MAEPGELAMTEDRPLMINGHPDKCSFCMNNSPELVLPLEVPFDFVMPGTGMPVQINDDWPICEVCAEFIDRRYFRRLAERIADERIAIYRAEGQEVIERAESVRFFVKFMASLVPHFDTSRDIYANEGWQFGGASERS